MTALSFRNQLHAQPFRPFNVKTADGDTFRVDHPDYAMVSPKESEVAIYDREGHFSVISLDLVVSLEPVGDQARKSGKR